MDDVIEIVVECENNEFCTNCPKRKGCGIREDFTKSLIGKQMKAQFAFLLSLL